MSAHGIRRIKCEERLQAVPSPCSRSRIILTEWLLVITVFMLSIPMVISAQGDRLRQPMAQQAVSLPQAEIVLSYAGSLNAVISEDVGPAFTAVTGFPLTNISGPSVKLANQIRSGQIQPDVFMSADAEVNQILMGGENGSVAPWYFTMCRQRMVIAYSPLSRFKTDFEAAAAGTKPWYEVLQTPGLILKRSSSPQ